MRQAGADPSQAFGTDCGYPSMGARDRHAEVSLKVDQPAAVDLRVASATAG